MRKSSAAGRYGRFFPENLGKIRPRPDELVGGL